MPRYILTGTPGAGKTAVLRLLETDGVAVVEEAATDVIAVEHALGSESYDAAFIDKVVTLQRQREARSPTSPGEVVLFDRAPVCTLALSRYLGVAVSPLLAGEVDRVVRDEVYEPTVLFVCNLGSSSRQRLGGSATSRRWSSNGFIGRPTASSGSTWSTYPVAR